MYFFDKIGAKNGFFCTNKGTRRTTLFLCKMPVQLKIHQQNGFSVG